MRSMYCIVLIICLLLISCSKSNSKIENIISITNVESSSIKKIEIDGSIVDKQEKVNDLVNKLLKVEVIPIESNVNIKPEKESVFIKLIGKEKKTSLYVLYNEGYIAVDYAPHMSNFPKFKYKLEDIKQLKKTFADIE